MSRLKWPIVENLDVSGGAFLSDIHFDNAVFALGEILGEVEGCFHNGYPIINPNTNAAIKIVKSIN